MIYVLIFFVQHSSMPLYSVPKEREEMQSYNKYIKSRIQILTLPGQI